MSKKIAYQSVVTDVRPGILQVEIRDETVCSACSAQKSCCMSGNREKRLEIPFTSGDYRPGDTVTVEGKASMGLKAVFIAFILPVILILIVLSVATSMNVDERQAAIISLSALAVYYLGIYFFRNKFKQLFVFTIKS